MTVAERPGTAAGTTCSHCGLPVPRGLIEPAHPLQFCCTGCATAWDLIHAAGLDRYYGFEERRERAVEPSGRRYEEFDHPAFDALYVRPAPGGLRSVELYLEGVHCASCVWLVERVPLAVPGTVRADLDVTRALAAITWDPGRTALSTIARFLDSIGYRPHPFRGIKAEVLRRAEDRAMALRVGVAGALAGNVMMLATAIYAGWFGGMDPGTERYLRWVSLLLTTPAMIWPGRVFFRGALAALRTRRLHMDVPVAIALAAGYLRGAVNTVTDRGPIYFDGVATLIFLLLVGRWLLQRAQRRAADAAELLHSLSPSTARLVDQDQIREIPAEALMPGMEVEVRAGDLFPADGRVLTGSSHVDVSLLTGESRPEAVAPGDPVYAGTINRSAALRVEVVETGEASRVGRILREVEAGSRRRAPVVLTADRLAGGFVAAVLVLAFATWLWWLPRNPAAALDNAIALLIVTCPCALALATPLAITSAIGKAARNGLLIKSADAIELLGRPGRMVLDKTGTLTEGRTALVRWRGPDWGRPLLAALERHSNHPLAEGVLSAWGELAGPEAISVVQVAGGGVEGMVGGHRVVAGSPAFVLATARDPDGLAPQRDPVLTPVMVGVDGVVVGLAEFGDRPRPEAGAAVGELRRDGWALTVLSGDDLTVVQAVAAPLGFETAAIEGGASPERKLRVIETAVATGPVVMVGDGINDAAAIARASVGVSVRGGAEASLAAADVYLVRPGLDPLVELTRGAARTLRVIRRNLAVSIGYNLVGAALAMTGTIDPLIAAVMMPVSSVTVVLASWRSRTFEASR